MMILWLVPLPGFLTISTVLRIVNVVSLVVPATVLPYLRIIGSHYNSSVGSVKYRLQNVKSLPECILEGTDYRDVGISVYCTHLLKFQDFWCISYILKELYCISEAPLDVLQFEL